jgi:hypothetical protein
MENIKKNDLTKKFRQRLILKFIAGILDKNFLLLNSEKWLK